jgi:hypothetical protein
MKIKLLLALLITQFGFAQHRTCGMEQQMQQIMSNPVLKQQYLQGQAKFNLELQKLEAQKTANKSNEAFMLPATTITIPLAVHYPSTAASNFPVNVNLRACLVALAQTQINILNADYNGSNTDISNWPAASAFYPGVNTGNMNVQFVLATINHPVGSGIGFPANGSPAVTFGTDFLNDADTDATWAGYCNLVVREIGNGILGYSPLGGHPGSGMTVVIDDNAFGASMSGSPATCTNYVPGAPYNLGRTLTHELGHFFNLDHTFTSCDGGSCTNVNTGGDGVCDTPSANDPEFNCLPAGSRMSGCGVPQLTMNYMDYVTDSCMYMFTAGQASRMIAWYNSISSGIKTNVLANDNFVTSNFSIAPNPNKGNFNIQFKDLSDGYAVEVFDISGRTVYTNNFNASSDLVQNVDLEGSSKGVYFITLKSNNVVVTKKIIIE